MSSITEIASRRGSVTGGVLLVAGSCIGAGMLALPVITGIGGFLPASVLFLLAWLFMTSTSLLLLEANLAVGYDLSLISIAEKTLGKGGKILCWLLFLFLFYSLSIAYIAASGSILHTIFLDVFRWDMPIWVGSAGFTLLFGGVLFIGVRPVDYLNRLLMFGLIVSYCALVFLGSTHVHFENLLVRNWIYSFAAIPVLIISFGFHNMVPSLAQYFEGDLKRLRTTLLVGSFLPLLIYLIWEAIMLGIIPLNGREGLKEALDQGQAATEALRAVAGKTWISTVGQAFALFAIVTSFLAQSLSLVDFLSDGLKIAKEKGGRFFLILLTLVPPFVFAFLFPSIFITALNMAGGFAAVILFGVFPVCMVWKLRKQFPEGARAFPLGKVALIAILAFAVAVFLLETAQELGWSLLPQVGAGS